MGKRISGRSFYYLDGRFANGFPNICSLKTEFRRQREHERYGVNHRYAFYGIEQNWHVPFHFTMTAPRKEGNDRTIRDEVKPGTKFPPVKGRTDDVR